MSWLTKLLGEPEPIRLNVTYGVQVQKELEPPFIVSFDMEAPLIGGGLILWAYSEEWTGCKGGSGFELALSQSRLRLCGLDGRSRGDQRFTVPWWGRKHNVKMLVGTDKILISMEAKDFQEKIMMQVLGLTPARLTVGVGWPPNPSIGFEGAKISNISMR